MQYLGHIIDSSGISVSNERVKAIKLMKASKDQSELRSFLDMINYFGKFFPHMSSHTLPLSQLLKKDTKWNWSSTQESAFQRVKQELTSLPIPAKYDMSLSVGLACDASEKGLGVCLFQVTEGKEHPVAYASKSLTKAQRNYSQIELETLSIIFGTRKLRHFLLGRKFVFRTDHRPLLTVF